MLVFVATSVFNHSNSDQDRRHSNFALWYLATHTAPLPRLYGLHHLTRLKSMRRLQIRKSELPLEHWNVALRLWAGWENALKVPVGLQSVVELPQMHVNHPKS